MRTELDWVLTESLLVGAREALDEIAEELIALHDGWVADGAHPSAVKWAEDLITRAGWWSGRLGAATDSR